MGKRQVHSAESVCEGHPDKVADQISDAVLDEIISRDINARVDCETVVMQGTVLVTGQISTIAHANVDRIARNVLRGIGLSDGKAGLDWQTCGVLVSIGEQSPDIAIGVNKPPEDMGAGDSGIVFGYAVNETPELMPIPIMLAHRIVKRLAEVRKGGSLPYLLPDGKAQATIEYEDFKPVHVNNIIVAAQHKEEIEIDRLRRDLIDEVIKQVVPSDLLDDSTRIDVNMTGKFVIGGTLADTGLTGRKIIVDSYGAFGSHGGGCMSGKDPTKVDRSGSYMARYIAKNIVAATLADRCEVQIAYAIGVARPESLAVETFGTGKVSDEKIAQAVREIFDTRPGMIIRKLDLLRPIFRKTSCYGHFGREDAEFTWERINAVDELRRRLG